MRIYVISELAKLEARSGDVYDAFAALVPIVRKALCVYHRHQAKAIAVYWLRDFHGYNLDPATADAFVNDRIDADREQKERRAAVDDYPEGIYPMSDHEDADDADDEARSLWSSDFSNESDGTDGDSYVGAQPESCSRREQLAQALSGQFPHIAGHDVGALQEMRIKNGAGAQAAAPMEDHEEQQPAGGLTIAGRAARVAFVSAYTWILFRYVG